MKDWLNLVRDVLNPRSPEHGQHLANLVKQEQRLTRCLRSMEETVTRDLIASTEEAAEF